MSTDKILSLLLEDSIKKLDGSIQERIEETSKHLQSKIEEIKTSAMHQVTTLESIINNDIPLVVNVGTVEAPDKKVVHKAFHHIIKILSSQKRKEKNIMIVGAAGGGKTYLVSCVADALKLPFYPMSVGLQTTKSDLLGFVNAQGGYVTSPIREAYEKGGVLLLDEFDAAHAGVVTILNSLLANGHCSFPDKIVEKHKDFICLCACNTYGRGGNTDYVGRNRLDAATLDRFIIVDVDYDEKLESALTGNDKWLKIINKIRSNAEIQGIKQIISPRASMDGADLLEVGFTPDEVLDMVVFKGANEDIKCKLMKDVDIDILYETPSYGCEMPVSSTSGSKPTRNITIDLDRGTYACASQLDGAVFNIGEYRISIDNCYTPYISGDQIYLNPTRRKFDGDAHYSEEQCEEIIDALHETMERQAHGEGLDYICRLNITVRFKHDTFNFVLE